MKKAILAVTLLFTTTTFAKVISINGNGVDGKPCSAVVTINDETKQLTDVKLSGATKDFEIIAETSKGYGPQKSVSPRGADQILEMFQESPKLYEQFSYKWSWLRQAEVYTLTSKDMLADVPESENELKFINGVFEVALQYNNEGDVYQVDAKSNFKTLKIVTLGSKKFSCQLPEAAE